MEEPGGGAGRYLLHGLNDFRRCEWYRRRSGQKTASRDKDGLESRRDRQAKSPPVCVRR